MTQITWTEPQLCSYDGDTSQPWFVYFDITNTLTGETKRKQFRGGINYWPAKDDRMREGNALKKMWKKKLELGQYNPFRKTGTQLALPPDNISEAIKTILALKKSSLKPKSLRNYNDISRNFLAWLEVNGLARLKLYAFTGEVAQAYLDYLLLDRNYSGKSHNNQLGILKAFFNSMKVKTRKWIEENPFSGIPELPEDMGRNIAYSPEEARSLVTYFQKHDRRMYYAVNFIAHGFIRKTELCELQVQQIDWDNMTIRIDSDESKNRIQDSVTISEELYKVMLEMGLDMAPKHYYIFGKGMQTCEQKCTRPDHISDRHLKLKKAFLAYCIKNNIQTTLKDDDEKAYYSWKGTGVIAYWKATKDIYAIMRQCRHSDIKTTMIYLKSLGLMPNEAFRLARVTL